MMANERCPNRDAWRSCCKRVNSCFARAKPLLADKAVVYLQCLYFAEGEAIFHTTRAHA